MNDILIGIKDLKTAFFETNGRFLPFLKKHWHEALGFAVGCLLIEQIFRFMALEAQAVGHVNLGAKLGESLSALMLLVIFSIQIPLRSMQDEGEHGPMGFWAFSQKHAKAYGLEGLVALGLMLLGTVFFVIPGILVQVAVTFFPFVIFCDSRYYSSDLNALKESWRLMKGLMFIGFFGALLALAGQLLLMQYVQTLMIHTHPLEWILYVLGITLTSVYICLLLYRLYRVRIVSLKSGQVAEGERHGSHI